MYLQNYGLRDKPFTLTHNSSFYYPAAHGEAREGLCYAIEERQGLAILIGEAGTGKTTLLKTLIASFHQELRGVLLPDVSLSGNSVLRQLCHQLALPLEDEGALPQVLQRCLRDMLRLGQTVVVLIDEAQALTTQQFQEVRFLTNLESDNRKLAQVILAGQPALDSLLDTSDMEALRQRVAVRTSIQPLTLVGTAAYIQFRLKAAGAPDIQLFTRKALHRIQEVSRGIPRWINLICDRALLVGYVDDAYVVDESMVETAASEITVDASEDAGVPSETTSRDSTLEARLATIELKLDALLESMPRAGFWDDLSQARSRPWVSTAQASVENKPDRDGCAEDAPEPVRDPSERSRGSSS